MKPLTEIEKEVFDKIEEFFDDENLRNEFHSKYTGNIVKNGPGHMICIKFPMEYDKNSEKPFAECVFEYITSSFAFGPDYKTEGAKNAKYFFIAMRCNEDDFTQKDEKLLRAFINTMRKESKPEIVLVKSTGSSDVTKECYFALMS